MAIKVKAVERFMKFDKESEGEYRYVLSADLYSRLSEEKVIKEAAMRSGKLVKRVSSYDAGDIGEAAPQAGPAAFIM